MSDAKLTRRDLIGRATITAAAAAAVPAEVTTAADSAGRLKQSIVYWCFGSFGENWNVEKTCRIARQLGCVSVEIVEPEDWPILKKHGLTCAIAPNGMPQPSFQKGFNNPRYHEQVIAHTKQMIDACAEAGVPNVIAFTGYKWRRAEDPTSGEISLEQGADHCVTGLKKIAPYAERKGVTICLEPLNGRVTDDPMKGHPGYQGERLDYCMEILDRVDSPRVKLLFDIYHTQVTDGDIIRRLHECRRHLAHVHTAGNPGRRELDDAQEIHYPPVMRALADIGYAGYVGHEFIPTRDPLEGLKEAVALCAV